MKLCKYRIMWATLIPEYGYVTKRDAVIIDPLKKYCFFPKQKEITIHAVNKHKLMWKLNVIVGRLHKPYKVYVYTDKQYSMRKDNNIEQLINKVLTKKQINNSFYIN